ncbi:hypothetical protein PVAP13_5NG226210 [Panicum virgatum]|uniref:F-box domain-containing protein n=1 Tax=Panicum virgatum TaxID=38727 RepID=A0A8T0RUI5_PANVG|nr:hypothetical protein PVAP13_5NG226210 [Panicum virgatum]
MQSTSKISSNTITSLSDDVLTDILFRLPSLASLARAALTCPRWRRLATSRDFLAGFGARHASLPLLSCFFYAGDGYYEVPVFQRARNLPDMDLAAVVRGSDFLLSSFFEDDLWTFKDIW